MMLSSEAERLLRNNIWYALTTKHANFAVGDGSAKRYPVEMTEAVAVADYSLTALDDLNRIIGKDETVFLGGFEPPQELAGWTIQGRYTTTQMVCEQPAAKIETSETILNLTAADVPEMFALVELTEPRPFYPRVIELGRYVGIRKDGQLIAMAGERFSPPGFQEFGSICTHPDHWGKGYATLLVSQLIAWNQREGNIPFLHVDPDKEVPRRVYQRLGFRDHFDYTWLVISPEIPNN